MLVLRNKETSEIIDPRVDYFTLNPNEVSDFDNWDDAFSQHREVDIVDGYDVIDTDLIDADVIDTAE